ncbi:MAG: DUF1874 domain-containing protein [Candidatus Doudnabacteria bacterium]|nr:DUF1874 domain-containing protein [Candidatus Doudnabacteria bacterium]
MSKSFVLNALSLNMLSGDSEGFRIIDRNPVVNPDIVYFGEGHPLAGHDALVLSVATVAIGHETTAALIQRQYGITAALLARVTVTLCPGDVALVFQYSGPRLPEGATVLPEGAKITAILVEVFGREKVLVSRKAAELALFAFVESAKANAYWSVGTDPYEIELANALGTRK